MVAPKSPGVLEFASTCSLGLRELMEAGAPLEKMVGKGLAHPPVLSHCNQQETQVMLPFFSLDQVILGEMTGMLLLCNTGAATGAGAVAACSCCSLLRLTGASRCCCCKSLLQGVSFCCCNSCQSALVAVTVTAAGAVAAGFCCKLLQLAGAGSCCLQSIVAHQLLLLMQLPGCHQL